VTARSSRTSTPAAGGSSAAPIRRVTSPAKSAPASVPDVTIRQAAFQHTASDSGSPVSIAAPASASSVAGSNAISA
jgi:hypothetical protein